MTNVAQPVTGQDINLAAQATRRALELLLAEQGTAFASMAALNTIVARGQQLDREALVGNLSGVLQTDVQSVLTILHGLETRGRIRQSTANGRSVLELTPEGAAEQQRITAITSGLTAQLYAGFDPEDLATTRRVLVTLTERAIAHVTSTVSRA